jgi:hypothetical protein
MFVNPSEPRGRSHGWRANNPHLLLVTNTVLLNTEPNRNRNFLPRRNITSAGATRPIIFSWVLTPRSLVHGYFCTMGQCVPRTVHWLDFVVSSHAHAGACISIWVPRTTQAILATRDKDVKQCRLTRHKSMNQFNQFLTLLTRCVTEWEVAVTRQPWMCSVALGTACTSGQTASRST